MKLIGSKEKGYQMVSSFEQTKPEKPGKPANTKTPPDGGTTGPDKGGKEE